MNFSKQSLVRSDLFEKVCDHTFWSDAQPAANANFKAGDIVFCKIDEVLKFFEQLRLTRKKIILVTGEGDYSCDPFRQQFLPLNVERWFATNVTHPHHRVTALPLGLGGVEDVITLNIDAQKSDLPKNEWLYINFRPDTNPGVRQKIYDVFQARAQHENWMTFEPPNNHGCNEKFLAQLKRHRFVLAPPGNGVDTHRLWEALALGAYPIALRSSVLEPFSGLPILFVDDYSEVTLDFLKVQLEQLEQKKKNNLMLQMSFWEEKNSKSKVRFIAS